MANLVKRDGLYYPKFSQLPYTGMVEGEEQGSIENGLREGLWIKYWNNGQLMYKGNYKNDKYEGVWVGYRKNGQVIYKGNHKNGKMEGYWVGYEWDGTADESYTGTWKDGVKISD